MQCLDDTRIGQYLRGALSADEMTAASEHIRACSACLGRLTAMSNYRMAVGLLQETATGIMDCPEYEELSAFVGELLSHEAHQRIERHIGVCELCWKDIETLQAVRSRASLAPPITVHPKMFPLHRPSLIFTWRRLSAVGTVAAAAVLAIVLTQGGQITKSPGVKVADKPTVTATKPADNRPDSAIISNTGDVEAGKQKSIVQSPDAGARNEVPVPAKSVFVADLRDGSVTVGRLDGKTIARPDAGRFEAQVAALVEEKLSRGTVPAGFQMAKLDSVRGPQPITTIPKISPTPGGLADPRPVFSWEPVEGASKYRVEVYQFDGTPVLTAEAEGTTYTPDRDLPGGGYKWVVRVRKGSFGEWQWSKAAAFRILTEKEHNLINRTKRLYPDSHLVLGAVYESLGLDDDAVQEFRLLARENPDSELARKLLTGIEQKLKERSE